VYIAAVGYAGNNKDVGFAGLHGVVLHAGQEGLPHGAHFVAVVGGGAFYKAIVVGVPLVEIERW
jgi:hypothetical protein